MVSELSTHMAVRPGNRAARIECGDRGYRDFPEFWL